MSKAVIEANLSDSIQFQTLAGFSRVAQIIEDLSQQEIRAITEYQSLLGESSNLGQTPDVSSETPPLGVFKRLDDIATTCAAKNWDGSDEEPISSITLNYAKLLANALPTDAPPPDIEPEPDGNINFEWRRSKDYIFEVSISNDGILFFAGMFGATKRIRGRLKFDDSIPEEINDILMRYF